MENDKSVKETNVNHPSGDYSKDLGGWWSSVSSIPMRPFWLAAILFLYPVIRDLWAVNPLSNTERDILFAVIFVLMTLSSILILVRKELPGKYGITQGRKAVLGGILLTLFWGFITIALILSTFFGW